MPLRHEIRKSSINSPSPILKIQKHRGEVDRGGFIGADSAYFLRLG
ncbi:hypothetical protein [Sulfuricurvum sp.]|nr:hypothetical protein [Sulfuricurvum sp.]